MWTMFFLGWCAGMVFMVCIDVGAEAWGRYQFRKSVKQKN